jgi:integrase
MLSDVKIRNSKAKEKAYKLTDAAGLHLFVTPAGSKLWRYKYSFEGREKLLSLGPYPDLSLAAARDQRDAAKAILRSGRDPSVQRKLLTHGAGETTFEAVARKWHALNAPNWKEIHAGEVLKSLEAHVFPSLGQVQMTDIKPQHVLGVIRDIEERPAVETARRVRQRMSAIFVHAIASGICEADPAGVVKGALAPLTKRNQPAIVELDEVRQVLMKAEAVPAHPVTKLGLRLLALTAVRPGEVRGASWREFEDLDGDKPLWRIPKERMKKGREHLVPLSAQAVAVLEAVRPLTGRGPLPFPNARWPHRPMSENAMGYLMNRAGYHSRHVPHGWRSAFSTVMNERYRADAAVIDLMLAHVPKDKTEAAYNRAQHIERRRELAQIWADLLSEGMALATSLLDGPRR